MNPEQIEVPPKMLITFTVKVRDFITPEDTAVKAMIAAYRQAFGEFHTRYPSDLELSWTKHYCPDCTKERSRQ